MLLLLLACGTSGGQIEASPRVAFDAPPIALHIEQAARVRIGEQTVAVDASGGRRWFDLAWVEGEPKLLAEAWASQACEAIFWDEPVSGSTWWARGGMCNVQGRRHWALILFRPTEADTWVQTAYLGDYAFVPYEDVWVDFVGTALSVGAGAPVEVASPAEVREHVRVGTAKGTGPAPIPGGGLISTRVHTEMAARYDGLVRLPARGPSPP